MGDLSNPIVVEAMAKTEDMTPPEMACFAVWASHAVFEGASRGPATTSEASDFYQDPSNEREASNARELFRDVEAGPHKAPAYVSLHWAAHATLLARSEPSGRAKVADAVKNCLHCVGAAAEAQGLALDLDGLAARAKEGKPPGRLGPHC